jgi:hypothetical protein
MESITLELAHPRVSRIRPRVAVSPRSVTWVLFFFAIVPAALPIRLIDCYGVNVPFGDEWSLVSLFAKWNDHQMTFADLFRQHNEHRILFPKLIYIAFAQLTHWNLRAEMFFSVFLCAITSACVYGLLRRTVAGTTRRHMAIWAVSNLLIFSPGQAENWFWGFQIQMFMPTVCLVGSLLILDSPRIHVGRFLSGCALAVVATFSFGSGLLLWPIVGSHLLVRGAHKRWIIWWTALSMIVALLYFAGYQAHPSPGQYHASYLDYVIYFLRFNGNALGQLPVQSALLWSAIFGAGSVLLYGVAVAAFFRWRGPPLRAAAPWIALATYALGSAVIATYSRVREGLEQALDSRYSSISVNLYIALVALLVIASDALSQSGISLRVSRITASLARSFMVILVGWYVVTLPEILVRSKNMSELRMHGLANLGFCKIIPPTGILKRSLRIHAEFPEFMQNVAHLERLDLLTPPLRRTNFLADEAHGPDGATEEFGRCETAIRTGAAVFQISGWAYLPLSDEPAPIVVLASESGSQWFGFALAEVNVERPDLVRKFDDMHKWSGWSRIIDTSALPKGARRISAWAVDAQTAQLFPLPGVITLPSE